MSLRELRESYYNRFRDARSTDYLVQQASFEEAYEQSDSSDRLTVEAILELTYSADPKARSEALSDLKAWIREKTHRDESIRDLREKARSAGVSRYSRLTKAELLSKLAQRTNGCRRRNQGQDLVDQQPCNGHSDSSIGGRASAIADSDQSRKA